jgi:hypothetical protein
MWSKLNPGTWIVSLEEWMLRVLESSKVASAKRQKKTLRLGTGKQAGEGQVCSPMANAEGTPILVQDDYREW